MSIHVYGRRLFLFLYFILPRRTTAMYKANIDVTHIIFLYICGRNMYLIDIHILIYLQDDMRIYENIYVPLGIRNRSEE